MFTIGDRVQLNPATDAWMRGDRYGEVVALVRNRKVTATGYRDLRVKMDKSGKTLRVSPELVSAV